MPPGYVGQVPNAYLAYPVLKNLPPAPLGRLALRTAQIPMIFIGIVDLPWSTMEMVRTEDDDGSHIIRQPHAWKGGLDPSDDHTLSSGSALQVLIEWRWQGTLRLQWSIPVSMVLMAS